MEKTSPIFSHQIFGKVNVDFAKQIIFTKYLERSMLILPHAETFIANKKTGDSETKQFQHPISHSC